MRVLLISALPELDPACGDVTYTQTLLDNPPDGIHYESYDQALSSGNLVEHYTTKALVREWQNKGKWLPELAFGAINKFVNKLRDANLLFAERFRFFSVKPGAYDLIHLHVFHVSFVNLPCPLLVSSGCPLQYLYADARRWSKFHIGAADLFEKWAGRAFNINLHSHVLPQAQRLVTYTEDARDWFSRHEVIDKAQIDIAPIFKDPATFLKPERPPRKILFVAKDFTAKGGFNLLKAFEKIKLARPDAELHVVGCEPLVDLSQPNFKNITWTPYVPREQLLKMFSEFDVFAYPTEFDCISYVLLEAMSSGLPIATSDYPSMPEAVNFGKAGKISAIGDSDMLAKNLIELLEPSTNLHFSKSSLNHFNETYSSEVVRQKLLDSYQACTEKASQIIPSVDSKKNLKSSI